MTNIKQLYNYLKSYINVMKIETDMQKARKDCYKVYFNKFFYKDYILLPYYYLDNITFISKYDVNIIRSILSIIKNQDFNEIYNYFYSLSYLSIDKYMYINRDINIIELEITKRLVRIGTKAHCMEYFNINNNIPSFIKMKKIEFKENDYDMLNNDIAELGLTINVMFDEINLLKERINNMIKMQVERNNNEINSIININNIINELNEEINEENKIVTYNYEEIKKRNKNLNNEFKKICKLFKFYR